MCGGELYGWAHIGSKYDYYCSAQHGAGGMGLFFNEVWNGEAYDLTPAPGQDLRTNEEARAARDAARNRTGNPNGAQS